MANRWTSVTPMFRINLEPGVYELIRKERAVLGWQNGAYLDRARGRINLIARV